MLFFIDDSVLLTGLGEGRKETAVCFDQKSPSVQCDSEHSKVNRPSRDSTNRQCEVQKGRGRNWGQPGGSVVLALEVGAPAGRAELHEVGGCVRKNAPIVVRWVLIFVFNPFSSST